MVADLDPSRHSEVDWKICGGAISDRFLSCRVITCLLLRTRDRSLEYMQSVLSNMVIGVTENRPRYSLG